MDFSKVLIKWYLQNKRDLPWRNTINPYYIWLSEIILQQTRVNQGLAYYEKFIVAFPTIFDLAKADENTVLNLWQGLGYYSRARNLHFSAKYIVNELDGIFPTTYKDMLKLKGVGDYTASAIVSICYNEAFAVVDGNVYRVLARYFGIDIPINSTEGAKIFKKLAQELIDVKDPATFNQAIMEFGATQCKPKNPDCSICPFKNSCKAKEENTIDILPFKDKKIKITKRFFNYLVIISPTDRTLISQRKQKGIWRNLYQFPLIETSKEIDIDELIKLDEFYKLTKTDNISISLFNKKPIKHKLSHQHLSVNFWVLHSDKEIENSISISDFDKYPVPILIHNFAETYF